MPAKTYAVYVAGAYSGNSPEEILANVHRAMDAGDALEDAGLRAFIPHLSHFRHERRPRPYAEWIKIDREWVRRCDVMLRLDGPSSGADGEVQLARELGMQIYTSLADLLAAWAREE